MTDADTVRPRRRPPFYQLERGHFGALLVDPPWKFKTYSSKGLSERSAEHHYTTQSIEWLRSLPVEALAARDCALFMWVVDSHLDVGIDLMRAWGFRYKTRAFVWVKTQKGDPTKPKMGMGLWTRKESELCIMGTRGKPPRLSKGVRQVVMEPRRESSRKPDCVRGRVEALVGGPYLELFARTRWPGWTSWGNEVDKFTCAPAVSESDGAHV